jgi:hypothetical protein
VEGVPFVSHDDCEVFVESSRRDLTSAPHGCATPTKQYRRTSISGTTFSGKMCLSGTIFHAIWLDFSMLFDNL